MTMNSQLSHSIMVYNKVAPKGMNKENNHDENSNNNNISVCIHADTDEASMTPIIDDALAKHYTKLQSIIQKLFILYSLFNMMQGK